MEIYLYPISRSEMQCPDLQNKISIFIKKIHFSLSAGAVLRRNGLILLQLQHDGPQSGDVLAVPGCLGTKITVFGHSLPLGARLNVIHLVPLVFSFLLSVAVLGLLYLSLVALVPVLQLLLGLHLQLLHSCGLLLVLLLQPLLLLLLPLPHELGLLLGHVQLRHSTGKLRGLALSQEIIVIWSRLAGSWSNPKILPDVSKLRLLFSKKLGSRINLRGCWDLELFLEVTHGLCIFVCRL